MNETFHRIAAPAAFLGFTLLCFTLPMVRHRLRGGDGSGFVLDRVKDPAARVVGQAMSVQSTLVLAHVLAFATFGPAAVSAYTNIPSWLGYAGVAVVACATVLVMVSQATMGRSWRMCVDDRPTDLVTDGPFRVVRNPIYLGTMLLNVGLALLIPGPFAFMLVYAGAFFVAIQARFEEAHLLAQHGEAYAAYAARVGRFLPGIGRVEATP